MVEVVIAICSSIFREVLTLEPAEICVEIRNEFSGSRMNSLENRLGVYYAYY